MNKLIEAKTTKLLNKVYFFDGKLSTYLEQIETYGIKELSTSIQKHSNKRIHLEYVELKTPRTIYMIKLKNNKLYEVPKLIYDYAKKYIEERIK